MIGFESFVLAFVLNSLWQVPLVVAAAWLAARLLRPAGPALEHRVWVGALIGGALLPAISLLPWERLNVAWPWRLHAAEAKGSVLVEVGAGVATGGLHIPALITTTAVLGYAGATLYFASRFAWRWWRLRELARTADVVELNGPAVRVWRRWLRHFAVERAQLVASSKIFAPLTMGIAQKQVMLPAEMVASLPEAELETVIGHELAHVRRQDFAKNLLYELVTLPVSYHPGVWFARQRMKESREMVCDQMAAQMFGGREYAESLLRLAGLLLEGRQVGVPYAIGVFDSSTLERRLMKLTEKRKQVGRARMCLSLVACVVLGIAAAASAVAMRVGVGDAVSAASKTIPTEVPAREMQDRVITKVPPVYPPDAKKERIQGKVILEAVIGTSGHVENLKVVSGPNELQQSAMDAVRQWVYKPYLVNGNPVEVTTKITVIYTLSK
jgi:TonB family protein